MVQIHETKAHQSLVAKHRMENEMTEVFLHNWDSKEDMIASFENVYRIEELTPEQIAKYAHVDVLLASYGTDNYNGDAFVLFRNTNDGKLYENHGSHCSCYGLEDQWGEELVDLDALKHRVTEGSLGSDDYSDNVFKDEILKVIKELDLTFTDSPMVRWIKIPAPGEIRGEGTWKDFDEVWPDHSDYWTQLQTTKFLPTKELPKGEEP